MLLRAGVSFATAQRDACRMEHAISEESFAKLRAAMDNKKKKVCSSFATIDRSACFVRTDQFLREKSQFSIDRQLCMNYILKTIKRVICRFQRAYGSLQLSLDCPPTLLESFWINGHFRSRVRLHEKFFILTAAPLTCYNWKGNGEWRIVDSSLTCFRPCCTSTFTPRLRWQTRWVYNCGRCDTTLRTLIVRKAHLRLLCWKRRCI